MKITIIIYENNDHYFTKITIIIYENNDHYL